MLIDIFVIFAFFFFILFVIAMISNSNSSAVSRSSRPRAPSPPLVSSDDLVDPIRIIRGKTYNIIYNDSPFPDNMNYQIYSFKAKYIETNRMRTREITAFSESDARSIIAAQGYEDPVELTQMHFDPPTYKQLNFCRKLHISVPDKACKEDVSCMIDKRLTEDRTPNPELLQYATEMKIGVSYYIGKRNLYKCIFNRLELRDRISFFVFCVYRYLSNDRLGNLNQSPHKDLFYEFADQNLSNDSFVRSLNKNYSGDDLRYFGAIRFKDHTCYGGSTTTVAYKDTIEFLRYYRLIK